MVLELERAEGEEILKNKKGNYKGRVPKVIAELRRQDIIKMTGEGVPNKVIAARLGITPVGVCKSLRKLRESMAKMTRDDYEAYRTIHRKVLLLIEKSLLEGKLSVKVASEWRQIRGDIALFDGLNSPAKSITAVVTAPSMVKMDFSEPVEKTPDLVSEQEYLDERAESAHLLKAGVDE